MTERRPGRPRQHGLETRVLEAVNELIDAGAAITVNAVVARSGVSRAAIYRRWSTMAELTAAALDVGRVTVQIPEALTVREALAFGHPQAHSGSGALGAAAGGPASADSEGSRGRIEATVGETLAAYPEERLRQRLQLALADRELQLEYWRSHVSRRRLPLLAMLERGQREGEVRRDADLEAALDLLSGVYYYQAVARGDSLGDPLVIARCTAAVDIIWRGIATPEATKDKQN